MSSLPKNEGDAYVASAAACARWAAASFFFFDVAHRTQAAAPLHHEATALEGEPWDDQRKRHRVPLKDHLEYSRGAYLFDVAIVENDPQMMASREQ